MISFWKKAERYGVIHLYTSSLGFLVLAALWVEQLSDSVFSSIASQQEGPGFELYNYLTMGLKGGDSALMLPLSLTEAPALALVFRTLLATL